VTQLIPIHISLLLIDVDVSFLPTSAGNLFPFAIAIYSAGYKM
jgi:hypothetical protein